MGKGINKRVLGLLLAVLFVFVSCSSKEATKAGDKKVKIGVSPVPHEEIAKVAKDLLKKEGIELEIVVFDDYVQPNLAVKDKDLDLNFFQHKPYMEKFNKENNTSLVSLGGVHVEPIAFYSKKVKSLDELKDGGEVIIPNDATNGSRALLLLSENNLIKLKEGKDLYTVEDIVENKKNIKFLEIEAALIPASLKDVDGAVINSNYALSNGLNPLTDGIVIENKESNYANVIATLKERENDEVLKKVLKAFTSQEVKKFIEDKYKGAIIPSF